MRVVKIVFGLCLLFAASNEYINASTQLGSFIKVPVIALLFFILICTWLLGSGFLNRKLNRFDFLKSFCVTFLLFVVFAGINLVAFLAPREIVEIKGLKIPLGKCMDGTRKTIPDESNRKAYCQCLFEKVLDHAELSSKYQHDLENDRANQVLDQMRNDKQFIELRIEECVTDMELKWTAYHTNSMKANWKKELIGSELEETNDLDKYCDCLAKELRIYPLKEVLDSTFTQRDDFISLREKCVAESKK